MTALENCGLSTTKRTACWKCSITTTNRWVCADPACFYGVTPEMAAETVASLGEIDKIIEEAEKDESGTPAEWAAKLLEIMAEVGILKADLGVAEAKLAGAEERANLLLEAKNLWMDRALKAEAK